MHVGVVVCMCVVCVICGVGIYVYGLDRLCLNVHDVCVCVCMVFGGGGVWYGM